MDAQTLDSLKIPVASEFGREEMAEYAALMRDLGIVNPEARVKELRAFLAENGITVYPAGRVDEYLRGRLKAANSPDVWCWKPLREWDRRFPLDARLGRAIMPAPPMPRAPGRLTAPEILFQMQREAEGQMIRAVLTAPSFLPVKQHGGFSVDIYPHAIPLPCLLSMKKIQDAFPEAQFYASDCRDPDPFLAVSLKDTSALFIIERWDEPGFRM